MYLYIDCCSGISGDMMLAALVDAGAPLRKIESAVNTVVGAIRESPLRITARREKSGVISGKKIIIRAPHQEHGRDWKTIRRMIEKAGALPRSVRDSAIAVFEQIAIAEARVHGEPIEHVHFHEVGALDSIADIVGVCFALDSLGIDEIGCSPVPLGHGRIQSSHGMIPLPAPATVEILKGMPVYGAGIEGETTTPTGAALLKALATHCCPMPLMKISKIGYGIGSRKFDDRPNALRLIIGEKENAPGTDRVAVIEANVDDMNPQDIEPLFEALLKAGALDVTAAPVQMKKNRRGLIVTALAREGGAGEVASAMLKHSTSLGVRLHIVSRLILKRSFHVAKTDFGDIHYKQAALPDGETRIVPEYEDLKAAAKRKSVSIETVRRAFWRNLDESN